MRDPVGVEELVGRLTIINVDHIVSIEAVEAHIAKELNYKTVLTLSSGGVFFPIESQTEIVEDLCLVRLSSQTSDQSVSQTSLKLKRNSC